MDERASDESDNEGFVPNQIKIDSHNIRQLQAVSSKRKNFQPHYIFSQGLLRKQPIQAIQFFDNIQMKPRTYQYKNPLNLNKDELPTVHQLFGNKNKYSSVYTRFKQPFGYGQKKAFQHQLKLNCCQNYSEEHFRTLKQWDQKTIEKHNYNESELIFDSRFEGGNLSCAFKSKKQINTYYLFMQNDTNTYGYNQWFYFSIKNAKANTKYKFKIANFKKSYSFFNNGLQPLIFSLTKAKKEGNGWYRGGSQISYHISNYQELNSCAYYTLEFTVEFDYSNDYITISPYPPYSYSKLILALKRLQIKAKDNQINWKLKSICDSICCNQIPYLVLSNKSKGKQQHKKKILILARQHSGETWSSYLIEEIMTILVQQSTIYAKWLLQEFDFHIFPMLNVDGVIYGNFRCDLAGNDLNRCWKNPWESLEPQIYHIKKEIEKLSKNDSIAMCLDLHTHSKAYGAFAYCCVESRQCKQLPSLIAKSCSIFRLGACTYGISGDKQATARAAVFGITQNINTLTIQLSGYGFRQLNRRYPCPFTPRSIRNIANGILKSYYAYKNNISSVDNIGQKFMEEQIIQGQAESSCEQSNISTIDFPVQGSDSEPQIDQIQLEVKMQTIFPIKFIEDIKYPKQRKTSKKYTKKQKKISKQMSTIKVQIKPQIKIKVSATSEVKQSIRSQKSQSLKPINTPQSFHAGQDELIYQTSAQAKKIITQNQPLYKKKMKMASEQSRKLQNDKNTKPLNLVQFSLKKLPINPPQKIMANPPNYHILLDEGPLVIGASYGKKDDSRFDKTFSTYQAMCRPRVRIQSKKIGFARQNSRLEQQLPFLCVMSENKKQLQLQKMKEKKDKSYEQKCQGKYIICGHRPEENTIIRFRDKQKQMELLSKIGLDHYARYAENSYVRKT